MAWTTCQCGTTLEPPVGWPGGAFRCPRCGNQVELTDDATAVSERPPLPLSDLPSWREDSDAKPPQKPNALAVIAMVFGVLSFVFNLLAALPAGLVGWFAQRQCDNDPTMGGRSLAGRAMETAVCGTIVNTVILLLIPGVQTIRDGDMGGMQNLNNMKQLALAAETYHDVYRKLPPAYGSLPAWEGDHSCFVWLLPYIEQGELFKHFERLPKDQANRGEADVDVLLAPLDATPNRKGATSYAGNIRVFSEIGAKTPPGEKVRRLPVMAKPLTFNQIKDGTSNTLLFANRFAECDGVATLFDGMRPNESGAPFFGGGSHVLPADGEPQLNRTFQVAPIPRNCRAEASVYGHSFSERGLAVARCDGAVRVISKNIEPRIFQFALCPDDGNHNVDFGN